MRYDVIIIGCGPAGLSSAIYLSRAKIKTLIIGDPNQTKLMEAYGIENYFGHPEGIQGKKLLDLGLKQVKKSGTKIINNKVSKISKIKNEFELTLNNSQKLQAKYLIFATGRIIPALIKPLKIKTEKAIILVNKNNQTSIKNIYAVGNCSTNIKQIAKNVGDGCNAAINIIRSLKKKDLYLDYGPIS